MILTTNATVTWPSLTEEKVASMAKHLIFLDPSKQTGTQIQIGVAAWSGIS